MPSSLTIWQETEKLINQGLNLIPVRDKDDATGRAKAAYPKWQKYQKQQITLPELHHYLEQFNTNAVAIICGTISGNLEVIDVDVKHEPGIDALLFDAIKEVYPNLWHILRIHKTPSGGYHILYKVIGKDVEGNKKLAERESTSAELEQSKTKKKAFIETRGEGGYVLAPPSLGYAVFKNNEIPVISWEDRCSLINLCRTFHKLRPEPERPKSSKTQESYYDENPFEHFNRSADLLTILEGYGWNYIKTKSNVIWLTKPGGKKNDVHAAIFLDKNLFYCHTTASDFEAEKIYNASSIIYESECNRDWKKVYAYLVERGYGRIKTKIETEIIKKGKELPANASDQAKQQQQQHQQQQSETHPYGIFWLRDDKDKLYISREHLYIVADGLGFINHNNELYQIEKPFIHKRTERQFFDTIKRYIKEEDGDIYIEICNSYEAFLQKSGSFSTGRLRQLNAAEICADTRNSCNKFFTNCYLTITRQNIHISDYTTFNSLVFYDRIQPREFQYYEGGVYPEFLKYAFGLIDTNVINTIGYLAHEYKDETSGYIIVLVEKCADPKEGGGSGKNLFSSLFRFTTSFISRPGAKAKFDEKFFQMWRGQRIFSISDVDERFDFLFLKEPATGNILWKRLWKDEHIVDVQDSPKLIVNTNYSYEVQDGGLRRRIIPIEFTDYFTQNGGVDGVFGKHFTEDWTKEDWNGYDTFIANAIKSWLASGRKLKSAELSLTGWEKQFVQSHGRTIYDFITEYFNSWVDRGEITNERFNSDMQDFVNENKIPDKYRPSPRNINSGLREFAVRNRIIFDGNCNMRDDAGLQTKGKKFKKQ